MTTDTQTTPAITLTNPGKQLSGKAKQYLDDLTTLNAKVTEEMHRGIREGYLDADGAVELAKKLDVEAPRVLRRFTGFFTVTQVYSVPVDAYDEDEALRELQRLHEFNVANGEVHYGSQSRFNEQGSGIRRVFSDMLWDRPNTANPLPESHPWEADRQAMREQGQSEYHIRDELGRRLNRTTVVNHQNGTSRRQIF